MPSSADFSPHIRALTAVFDFSALSRRDGPAYARVAIAADLTLARLLQVVPHAHAQGQVRLIDEGSSNEGHSPEWLARTLKCDVATLSVEMVDEIIQRRLCTVAVQSMERFDPVTAEIADALGQHTGRRVSVTAFISPPKSKGTSIHYDRSDVFVVHVEGTKRWRVYAPIDVEPNHRTPYQDPLASPELRAAGDWKLERGSSLYLPSGWIHEVTNDSEAPCVHLSFVIFSDSLISVFGNAMTDTYASLMLRPEWRSRLTVGDLTRADIIERFGDMLEEFQRTFLESLRDDPGRFCDHILTGAVEQARRSVARETISVVQNEETDVIVDWVGIQHRAIKNGSKLEISTDGTSRYGINPHLYAICKERKSLTLDALTNAYPGKPDEVIDFVAMMVRDLGLLSLRPIEVPVSNFNHQAKEIE